MKTKVKYFLASGGVFLATAMMILLIYSVNSQTSDTAIANVTVVNAVPALSNVLLTDSDGGAIGLSTGSDTNLVICNATVTDLNGYQDVSSNGGANATFYFAENGTNSGDGNDKNHHYRNDSCTFSVGSGTTATINCTVYFEHEALNGTWDCNITVWDAAGANASANDSEEVSQLIALSVEEAQIAFGTMTVQTNSSAGNSTNVTNSGNVPIDIQVQGNGDMGCSTTGSIGIGNISYNYTDSNYDSMSLKKLTTGAVTETDFNLTIEGIGTAEDINATKLEYWTINIPVGVSGECNNTITITAITG